MTMEMIFRSGWVPGSNSITIMFGLPNDFTFGGIADVPGVVMREAQQRGDTPLVGIFLKVTPEGHFKFRLPWCVGLMKKRPWLEIPIVYKTGQRAIVEVEKGKPGEQALDWAFAEWGKYHIAPKGGFDPDITPEPDPKWRCPGLD